MHEGPHEKATLGVLLFYGPSRGRARRSRRAKALSREDFKPASFGKPFREDNLLPADPEMPSRRDISPRRFSKRSSRGDISRRRLPESALESGFSSAGCFEALSRVFFSGAGSGRSSRETIFVPGRVRRPRESAWPPVFTPWGHLFFRVMGPGRRAEKPGGNMARIEIRVHFPKRPRFDLHPAIFFSLMGPLGSLLVSPSGPSGGPEVQDRRRERPAVRGLSAGAIGNGPASSSFGLSFGRYDSPSITKS